MLKKQRSFSDIMKFNGMYMYFSMFTVMKRKIQPSEATLLTLGSYKTFIPIVIASLYKSKCYKEIYTVNTTAET